MKSELIYQYVEVAGNIIMCLRGPWSTISSVRLVSIKTFFRPASWIRLSIPSYARRCLHFEIATMLQALHKINSIGKAPVRDVAKINQV